DHVDRKREFIEIQRHPIAECRVVHIGRAGNELRAAELLLDPRPVWPLALEHPREEAGVDGRRRAGLECPPSQMVAYILALGESSAHVAPRILLQLAVDIVVARHDEKAAGLDLELGKNPPEDSIGRIVFLLETPIRDVASEAEEIDGSISRDLREHLVELGPEHPL